MTTTGLVIKVHRTHVLRTEYHRLVSSSNGNRVGVGEAETGGQRAGIFCVYPHLGGSTRDGSLN